MNKTIFFFLTLCLFARTNTSAQTKPNPIWQKDFVDTCVVIPFGVDFGLCAMPLGWALSDSGCVMLSGCSMIGSNGTDYSTSFFQSSYQCNGACIQDTTVVLACIDSNQINLNVLCPAIYEPVCGCDSITYSNSCEATNYGGVVSFTEGECASATLSQNWMSLMDIQPNPFTSNFKLTFGYEIMGIARLFQANGILISSQHISNTSLEFMTDKLAPGTYFIQVSNQQSGQQFTKRIIKH